MWATVASTAIEEGRPGHVDGEERGKLPGCIKVDGGKRGHKHC